MAGQNAITPVALSVLDYSSGTTAFSPMSVVPGVFTLGTIASTTIT